MAAQKDMEFYVLEVTPEMAAEFLATNVNVNRTISQPFVRKLAEVMKAGEWFPTHQPIAFDTLGRLFDGQHRLSAVVVAGIPVMMGIMENCDPKTFMLVDRGQKRTSNDLFVMSYKRKFGEAPSQAPYISSVATGMIMGLRSTDPKREEIVGVGLKHYKLIAKLAESFGQKAVKEVSSTRVIAAFAKAYLYFGAGRMDPLVERFTTQMWSATDDPLKALYVRLQAVKLGETRHNHRTHLSKMEKYAVTVHAIRMALRNMRATKVQIATNDFGETDIDKKIRRGEKVGKDEVEDAHAEAS
jgi:hypothetical protein